MLPDCWCAAQLALPSTLRTLVSIDPTWCEPCAALPTGPSFTPPACVALKDLKGHGKCRYNRKGDEGTKGIKSTCTDTA